MDFDTLKRDLQFAILQDEKYERENKAKFRAVEQKVSTYDEFRELVRGSHLIPLTKKESVMSLARGSICTFEDETTNQVHWNKVANTNRNK